MTAPNPDRVVACRLAPDGAIPNHPRWPLLVYPAAVVVAGADPAGAFEALFARHRWLPAWRNGVYPFHYFHSNAQEVLGVYSGAVTVRFGGDRGVTLTARAGDVIVPPADTGRKKLASKRVLGIVGAYPAGQEPDMCRPQFDRVPHPPRGRAGGTAARVRLRLRRRRTALRPLDRLSR